MLKKIKDFFLDMLFAPSGTAVLVFGIMLLLSLFNLLNTTLFFSGNGWMILMLPIAFGAPSVLFWLSRGTKKYIPTIHFSLPKKVHIPTLAFGVLTLFLGSVLLKMLFFEGRYTEFFVYNTFYAHRNGNLWNDLYLVLMFCILCPVLEGIVFRGAIMKEHDRRGRLTVSLYSTLLFSLLGFSFEDLIPRLFLGFILCMILYATDSLATTIAVHMLYNVFAVFFEPTLVAMKNVSSNFALFAFIVTIITLVVAILFFSHLSRLYKKYSRDKFGENFVRSTPRERTFWHFVELSISIPAIACYVLFLLTTFLIEL